jgi:glutamyl-tRNA(Gln) amidotransferase subunit E
MDYKTIGFKAGLEIHQQLNTHKLFCQCQSRITNDATYSFERTLRPTQSEMGDVDRAALDEAQRKRRFRYTASGASTCLVEADEEPPHTANTEAVDCCLTMALLLGATPVDEIQFMRKIVIDGSNTTGFQRTALVAMNGSLQNVRISTLTLEEDAARKVAEKDNQVTYGLDRLGIPLIEITTAADITTPEQVSEVAEQLGTLLQATRKVKRGLGTIRQDLNVSIQGGARIEVKGIQSLSSLSKVAEQEVRRQMGIREITETLRNRVKKSDFEKIQSVELSSVLSQCSSKMIQHQLRNNGCVKGIRLPGYHGLLKREHTRIGKDLAVYAGLATGIGGIIHSDEMPEYGLREAEIQDVKKHLQLGAKDAFVLALGNEAMVDAALQAVLRRATLFFDGVPEEVRRSLLDNTTEYMRPLPGAARMYPETDVPPIRITQERLQRIQIPEKPEEKRNRFETQFGLNQEQITQLLSSGYDDDFERMVKVFPTMKNVIIRTFLNTFPELEKKGISTEGIDDHMLQMLLSALSDGRYAKEAVPQILKYLLLNPTSSLNEAMQRCGLQTVSEEEIRTVVRTIILERKDFIRKRGADSLGPLMGMVMKQLRGKVDGKLLSKTLQEEIQKLMIS